MIARVLVALSLPRAFLPFAGGSGDDTVRDAAPAAAPAPEAPIDISESATLSATARQAEYRQLDAIVIDVEFKSHSDRMLYIGGNSSPYSYLTLEVRDKRGREVERSTYFKERLRYSNNGVLAFTPGSTSRQTLIANLVCDMTLPGTYEITVRTVFDRARKDDEAHAVGRVATKPITVRVKGAPVIEPGNENPK
jgi:hypothetical protein